MSEAVESPKPSDEQAAEMAELERRAAEADAAPAGQPAPAAAAEEKLKPPSEMAMMVAAGLVRGLRPVACHALPSLKEAPADTWGPAVEGTAALLDHYGGMGKDSFAASPWGRFVVGLVPLAAFAGMQALTAPAKDDKPAAGDGPARIGRTLDVGAPVPASEGEGQRTVIIGSPIA